MFMGVFFAIRLKLTNVSGTVDNLTEEFQQNADQNQILGISQEASSSADNNQDVMNIDSEIQKLTKVKEDKINKLCTLEELSYMAPKNVQKILGTKRLSNSDFIESQMIFAVETHIPNKDQYLQNIKICSANFDSNKINEGSIENRTKDSNSANIFGWPDKKEWSDVMESIKKDKPAIEKAAIEAKIEPRLIVMNLMVEQLRLFYSQRELYKRYFEPLKILANSNKISLGVMSIKEETAALVENHLKDSSSPYYLGPEYEHLLDYSNSLNVGQERYRRLTSSNHYYNYLYGGLYLKQMMKQWKDAGYDIDKRPEIIGTLFNVGFPQSKPNPNPKVGGSTIKIDQTLYSFGRLAYEFYYSGEMVNEFPYKD
jgi:hypothetical protein